MSSLPADTRGILDERIDQLLERCDPATTDPTTFLGTQFDLGLAWVHLPEGSGGLGLPADEQEYVRGRLGAHGAPVQPYESLIGLGMAAPTIARHGTEAQRKRHLRRIFTAEEIWCQLFSEPGAGSDVGGLSTTAAEVEGGWLVNGQKVWTTFAHIADWGLLLARSDPDVAKHRGLTYFLLDMKSPGVDVRPLYQVTGEAEFNEVYLTDVFVPDERRVDERGAGWTVAITTLMNERAAIGTSLPGDGQQLCGEAFDLWRRGGWDDPVRRDELVQLWIRAELISLTARRGKEAGLRGKPGPEGSVGKLAWAEFNQDLAEFCTDLYGRDALLYPPGYERRRPNPDAPVTDPRYKFLRARANSIEGGTSEVMRNIIGERVLGLPGEPRVDKDIPWRDVRRG